MLIGVILILLIIVLYTKRFNILKIAFHNSQHNTEKDYIDFARKTHSGWMIMHYLSARTI